MRSFITLPVNVHLCGLRIHALQVEADEFGEAVVPMNTAAPMIARLAMTKTAPRGISIAGPFDRHRVSLGKVPLRLRARLVGRLFGCLPRWADAFPTCILEAFPYEKLK